MDEWQSADERNNREKISRARQAAEELFKSPPHIVEDEPPQSASPAAPAAQRQQRRQPRIFTLPPRLPTSPEVDQPANAPASQEAAVKRPRATVPPSQFERVRALATYGMTTQQVADLYGVRIEEIDRILKKPARSGRLR